MRRRLVLMRHARSSWNQRGIADRDRPLSARGRRDAPRVAEALQRLGWRPDLAVTSDARRARETWEHMAPTFLDVPHQVDARLYLAGLDALRTAAERWPDGAETVLVIGHNPGWELALAGLADPPPPEPSLPTAAAALLEGEGAGWSRALAAPWRLLGLLRPRELA